MEEQDGHVSRKEREENDRSLFRAHVSTVLATPSGRAVLAEVLRLCQVGSINNHDGAAGFRVEGARAVGINIENMLRAADFEGFIKLYREIHGQ